MTLCKQKDNPIRIMSYESIEIAVKVSTHASQNKIIGPIYNAKQQAMFKISIVAVPESGKANKYLIAFLAKLLNIPQSKMTIVSGITARTKVIRFQKLNSAQIQNITTILYEKTSIQESRII